MCGIFAAIHSQDVIPNLMSGLSLLSYRGYDSAGIAVVNQNGFSRQRAPGKLENLAHILQGQSFEGSVGIAHTRWATHGLPNERNAHPHMTSRVALVHNGIVENYGELKRELESNGYLFESDTDSESIAQLITYFCDQGENSITAMQKALERVEGSYGIAVIFKDEPKRLYVARRGNPLVVGRAAEGFYVSSDENALANLANGLLHLQDGEIAAIEQTNIQIFGSGLLPREYQFMDFNASDAQVSKQGYQHYMLKEINEQTQVFERCWHSYFDKVNMHVRLPAMSTPLNRFSRFSIVACGTSYYSGMVAKYWIEQLAGIPVDLDIASEFRYRGAPVDGNGAALFISQSGETADTLAALRHAKSMGQTCFTLVNVINSSMAQEADVVLPTLAGPEIGVASTKAFMSQLTTLLMLTMGIAKSNRRLSRKNEKSLFTALRDFSSVLDQTIHRHDEIKRLAENFRDTQHALFLGRGFASALAYEGALKMKEISYIHAEAYPAGELKHGPLALVDEHMPVVMIAPPGPLFSKTLSNLREVASRGGRIILLSSAEGLLESRDYIVDGFELPEVHPLLQSMIYTVPLQLLAYYCALDRGNDVDQPRNLAKSVTVE